MIPVPQFFETKTEQPHPAISSGGFCRSCRREHRLGPGNTLLYCRQLMQSFTDLRTIDLFSGRSPGVAELTTDVLFGPARGKMFGVLECIRADGTTTILRAFSGQYNGNWLVDGWVPPVFVVEDFFALSNQVEPQIKALSREIDGCAEHDEKWLALRKTRRKLSRQLMKDLYALYQLRNFRGESASLGEAFNGKSGIPTGTADCCAPKLLNYAAEHQLRPIGLSEFYWGRENSSKTRQHGTFSGSCAEKCMPILGFMLCGLNT